MERFTGDQSKMLHDKKFENLKEIRRQAASAWMSKYHNRGPSEDAIAEKWYPN